MVLRGPSVEIVIVFDNYQNITHAKDETDSKRHDRVSSRRALAKIFSTQRVSLSRNKAAPSRRTGRRAHQEFREGLTLGEIAEQLRSRPFKVDLVRSLSLALTSAFRPEVPDIPHRFALECLTLTTVFGDNIVSVDSNSRRREAGVRPYGEADVELWFHALTSTLPTVVIGRDTDRIIHGLLAANLSLQQGEGSSRYVFPSFVSLVPCLLILNMWV